MIDRTALRVFVAVLAAWLTGRQQDGMAYLIEENRILRRHLRGRRLRLTDDERRRLAVLGHRLGRGLSSRPTKPWKRGCQYRLTAVIDHLVARVLLAALFGWLHRQQRDVIAYLIEENRTLRSQLGAGDCG